MSTLALGPVQLSKVGDFARAAKDPSSKAPAEVAARFPARAENLRRDARGTWHATVEEEVTVEEDGRPVKRPRHRIHWQSPGQEVRVAADVEVFHEIAFADDVALLTGDRGALWQLSLDDGRLARLPLVGHRFDDEARLYEISFVAGDRVVISEREQGCVIVARWSRAGLQHLATFPFKGAFAVVADRFLVGGAKSVHVYDLAAEPVEVGATTAIGVTNLWRCADEVRLYAGKGGAWRIEVVA